jgi:tetratricopeptide (TPR) repeat protein
MAFLGEFLYYQGEDAEAEQWLKRAVEARGASGDDVPLILAGFLYASRGERAKIDPHVLSYKPSDLIDGDTAYWVGGVHCMVGDRQEALALLRRAVELGNHNYPWFMRDKNWDKLRSDPEYQAVLKEVEGYWQHYRELFQGK